ncbi:hypothetical protein C8J56DRAFT_1162275 [Mycena floridula]|nr:hypothetical protein C8J56DRAFT_1162275 [Mycena floridula]
MAPQIVEDVRHHHWGDFVFLCIIIILGASLLLCGCRSCWGDSRSLAYEETRDDLRRLRATRLELQTRIPSTPPPPPPYSLPSPQTVETVQVDPCSVALSLPMSSPKVHVSTGSQTSPAPALQTNESTGPSPHLATDSRRRSI